MSDTKPIRQGEELNEKNLAEFLRKNLDVKTGEIKISQFPAGNSNLTYCVLIGNEEYVLRRPPFGNQVKSAHDMAREFNVLEKLSRVYKPAPKPLLYCADENIIGSEFYLMERRKGLIMRGKRAGKVNRFARTAKKSHRNFYRKSRRTSFARLQKSRTRNSRKTRRLCRQTSRRLDKKIF